MMEPDYDEDEYGYNVGFEVVVFVVTVILLILLH